MPLHILPALIFAILPSIALFAQSPLPQRLELSRYDTLPSSQLISGAFYPLGFSEDGKFAYATAPADEACGCYFFEFRIQDLVTDRVLYRYSYHGDEGKQMGLYENLEELWAAKSEMFSRKMKVYGIAQHQPPFEGEVSGFEVLISPKEFLDPGLGNTSFVRSAHVQVRDPKKGMKTVSRLHFPNSYVNSLEAIGYFQNPYEDRIALLLTRIKRGWEGLPRVLDFEVIGVHRALGYCE